MSTQTPDNETNPANEKTSPFLPEELSEPPLKPMHLVRIFDAASRADYQAQKAGKPSPTVDRRVEDFVKRHLNPRPK